MRRGILLAVCAAALLLYHARQARAKGPLRGPAAAHLAPARTALDAAFVTSRAAFLSLPLDAVDSCDSGFRRAQARFMMERAQLHKLANRAEAPTRPSACSTVPWVAAVRDADASALRAAADADGGAPPPALARTAIVVGANKGYSVAALVGAFHPASGVGPPWLRGLLEALPGSGAWADKLCGVCGDCNHAVPPPPGGDGAPAWLAPRLSLTVHAVEPQPSNVELLRGLAGWVRGLPPPPGGGAPPVVVVHPLGASAAPGVGLFEERGPGDEGSSLGNSNRGGGALVEARLTTVDELWGADRGPLDVLAIDAEGHDPAVLAGAAATLPATRLVRFEYHSLGLWGSRRGGGDDGAPPASLRGVTASLEAAGFTCFLEWEDTLLQLTAGCWDGAFEFRGWANVLCANRRDAGWHEALQALSWRPPRAPEAGAGAGAEGDPPAGLPD